MAESPHRSTVEVINLTMAAIMLGQPRQNESSGQRSRFIRDAGSLKCCLFSVMKSAAHRSLRWTQICLMVDPTPTAFQFIPRSSQTSTDYHSRMLSVTMCLAGQEVRKTNVLTFISCLYLIVTEQVNVPLWSLCGSEAEINKVTSL